MPVRGMSMDVGVYLLDTFNENLDYTSTSNGQ